MQYMEWHKLNKPKQLPLYPNRAYEDKWQGWNDFLGTNNEFNNKNKIKWRPLAEAIVWVHKLGLRTFEDWTEYVKANRETMPRDIPSRPDLIYSDWRSWMHWLGSKPKEKVEAQRQVLEEAAIFYCIQEKDYAHHRTIFTFGVEKGGVSGLKDRWEMSKNFRVIRMFRYDETQMNNVKQVIERLSTPYFGAESIRIVPNINALVWEISNYLDFVNP